MNRNIHIFLRHILPYRYLWLVISFIAFRPYLNDSEGNPKKELDIFLDGDGCFTISKTTHPNCYDAIENWAYGVFNKRPMDWCECLNCNVGWPGVKMEKANLYIRKNVITHMWYKRDEESGGRSLEIITKAMRDFSIPMISKEDATKIINNWQVRGTEEVSTRIFNQ